MNFFIQTLSEVFKSFALFVKGDKAANEYIKTSEAHWLLSWLMVIVGTAVYLFYLPTVFVSDITQETMPETATYFDFKSANLISFVFVFLMGYMIIYLMAKPLEYAGSIRRYIIIQNWILLISILVTLPISLSIASGDSPFVSLFIFTFLFLLFFAYRSIKITLGVNGVKAFMLLLILVVFELTADGMINDWYGLTKEIAPNNPPS